MAEGKGIPWKGKAAERGGSEAAASGAAAPPRPTAPTPTAPAPAAPAVTGAPPAPTAAAAPTAGGGGGKAIPWKGKAAAEAAARPAPAAAAVAPAAPAARVGVATTARPAGPPPVLEALKELVPDLKSEMRNGYAEVSLSPQQLPAAARLARREFNYDYLSAITAVDWQDRFELLYHLYS